MNNGSVGWNQRVLVIGDNPASREAIGRILAPDPAPGGVDRVASRDIDLAGEGEDAARRVITAREAGRPYAVVLVDGRETPPLDAAAQARKLGELDPDLEVLMCAPAIDASWEKATEINGSRSGVIFLKSPFATLELRQWVQVLVEKWFWRQQGRRKMAELDGLGAKVAEELSRHEQAEARLRATLTEVNELKTALDTHAIVAITNPQGRITYVNDKFCAISQYRREELLGQDHRIINSGHHPKEFFHQLWTTIAQGRVWQGEIMNRAKDGTAYWVDTTIVPFLNEAGKPRQYVAIRADTTARKQVEVALRASEASYHFMADVMPQIVWTARPDGQLDYCNQRWYEFTGLTADMTRAAGWRAALHPDDARPCGEEWTKVLGTGGDYQVEGRLKRAADGAYRWHLGRAFPSRNAAGEIIQWVGTWTDIDDHKLAEEALHLLNHELEARVAERTADLLQSNRELEQFAYVASHDLQEPLRAVAGCTQILQQRYQGKLDAGADELIRHAVDGASRMQALIQDLLTYSRIGTKAGTIGDCDAAQVLGATLVNLQVALQESRAVFTHDPLPVVRADPWQLGQVLQNLIGNALKYRGPRLPQIHLGVTRQSGAWRFRVQDNGIGIEARYFERIFGVFQRLHTRKEFPGTGIGLAICKKVIERHGGRIWLESTPGLGSIFYFTLPDRVPKE